MTKASLKIFIVLISMSSSLIGATPDLNVHLNSIELKSIDVTVRVERSIKDDKLSRVELSFTGKNFQVSGDILKTIWAPDLQSINFTQHINLERTNDIEMYYLYIPYYLHSESGEEPKESEPINAKELVIHFNSSGIVKVKTRDCERCNEP